MDNNSFPGVDWARAEDEDALFQHLLELHQENGMFLVSERKVRDFIRQATKQEGAMIGIIRGTDGIAASIGMVIDQWWYSEDFVLSERWNFVHPSHRHFNYASRLIEFAKWCDEKLHLPLAMGIMSTTRTEAKERLYRRKLTPVGGLFMHSSDNPIVSGSGDEVKSQYFHLNDLRAAVAGKVNNRSPEEQKVLNKVLKQAKENVQ